MDPWLGNCLISLYVVFFDLGPYQGICKVVGSSGYQRLTIFDVGVDSEKSRDPPDTPHLRSRPVGQNRKGEWSGKLPSFVAGGGTPACELVSPE